MTFEHLCWLLSGSPGAVEAVFSRSFGGLRTPYDWLARSVSTTAKRVLVLACGSGGMVERLQREGRLVVGLDWAKTSIDVGKRRDRRELIQADANYLPFAAETFDAVVSDLGLGVNENRDLMLREVARVLRSGGIFAGLTPSMRPMNFDDARVMARLTRILGKLPQVPGEMEFAASKLFGAAGMQKAEDARAKFYFAVRSREDAELLIAGLRATSDAQRACEAVSYLTEHARKREVRIPLPFRRLLALK